MLSDFRNGGRGGKERERNVNMRERESIDWLPSRHALIRNQNFNLWMYGTMLKLETILIKFYLVDEYQ